MFTDDLISDERKRMAQFGDHLCDDPDHKFHGAVTRKDCDICRMLLWEELRDGEAPWSGK